MTIGDMVKENLIKVLEKNGMTWVNELARKMDLSPATVSKYVKELEKSGKVKTKKIGNSKAIVLNKEEKV